MTNSINIDDVFSTFHLKVLGRNEIEALQYVLKKTPEELTWELILKAQIILCSYNFSNITSLEESIFIISNILKEHPSIEYQAWADLYAARISYVKENIEEAIRLYRKAITSGENGFLRIEAQALFRLATIYSNYGAIDEAVQCYLNCVDISRQIKGLRLQVLALSSLSEIYLTNGQVTQAREICRDALKISQDKVDAATKMRLRIRECTILLETSEVTKIFPILDSIKKEIESYPDPLNDGVVSMILGKAYRLQKEYDKSSLEFERALTIYRKSESPKAIANALQQLVELNIEIGNYSEGWKLLKEANDIASKANNLYATTASLELSVELYQKQGQFDKALAAFREFYDMKQKMLSQQAERRMELLRIEHQVKEKEREAELYRVKSEQLQKQLMDKTAHLVSQAESVSRFRDDLKNILIEAKDPISGLREVKNKLKDLPQIAVNWDEYDRNFSLVHPQFKQALIKKYSDLTPTEMKVCTLLRMELSSKEIAHLLTVDERSIENYRYKLRKKFRLEKESLSLFLSNI